MQNLGDMRILFTSMSPAIVEFFDNAFNVTRFTKVVRNLDWELGDSLEVFSTNSSAVTQKLAGQLTNEGKPKAEESDEIQNR